MPMARSAISLSIITVTCSHRRASSATFSTRPSLPSARAVLAIVLGAAQAWIVERTDTPLRQYVFLIAVMSLGIPHVLYTVAWLLILGKGGPVNLFLMGLLGTDRPGVLGQQHVGNDPDRGHDLGAARIPAAVLRVPHVRCLVRGSRHDERGGDVHGISPDHAEARDAGACLALLLLVCIRAFEAFDIPALVGNAGGISVLSTDIFESIRKDLPSNYGQAGAFSVILMAIVVILLAVHRRVLRHAERYQTITGKGYRPRVMHLGRWRYLTSAVLCTFFVVLLVIPVGMIVLASLLPFYDGVRFDVFSRLTLDNYRLVANSPSFRGAILNTLLMGAATATAVCLLTAGSAWLSVRRYKGGWLLDQLATLPLIFPSIVLGVAFLQLFVNAPIAIYGTLSSLVIAASVQYLPYGMRFCHAGAMQIHPRARRGGGNVRCGASRDFCPRRIAIDRTGGGDELALRHADVGARRCHADPAGGAALAGRRRDAVRSLGQWADHVACGGRRGLDRADDVYWCRLLSLRTPLWLDGELRSDLPEFVADGGNAITQRLDAAMTKLLRIAPLRKRNVQGGIGSTIGGNNGHGEAVATVTKLAGAAGKAARANLPGLPQRFCHRSLGAERRQRRTYSWISWSD